MSEALLVEWVRVTRWDEMWIFKLAFMESEEVWENVLEDRWYIVVHMEKAHGKGH